ncbi:MAG: hypothetical protein PUP91_31565 [Rhizonema sp. PD37]|nr:hypothetical protein [Rhizonema sp. PD37]
MKTTSILKVAEEWQPPHYQEIIRICQDLYLYMIAWSIVKAIALAKQR